jgi:predicted GTPase
MLERFHSQQADVLAGLRQLATLANEVGARSLGARLATEVIKKLETERFHLVVVGEFNHGKTTFVNALLGASVLPVGVTPTTAIIHHLAYADAPAADVVLVSEARTTIPFEQVRLFAVGNERAPHPVAREQGVPGNPEDVSYLDVGYPADLLRGNIVLVDTPGVNDLSLQRADITFSYIPRADAVLFLLDAGQPLKESERVFLQDKLLGQSRDKIIFVVAKKDIWSDDEQAEALIYIRSELAKLVKAPVVFAVSAEWALAGRTDASGMPELVAHLSRFLAEERGRILLENALGDGLQGVELLGRGVEARRRAVSMSSAELSRRLAALEKDLAGQARTIEERRAFVREEVSAIRAWVRRDLEHFVEDVVRQLPDLVDSAPAEDLKSHLGAFLERTLADWAQAETKEIAGALEAMAEKTVALVREDANDVAARVGNALGTDVKAPDVAVDTFSYDVGVVALATIGLSVMFTNVFLGGLMALAAPVLAVYVRNMVETETRKRAKALAPVALREATARMAPKLDDMIQGFAQRLDAWVVTAGEELHREVIEVLSATREERARTGPATELATKACEAQGDALAEIRGRLTGLRAALWSSPGGQAVGLPSGANPEARRDLA